MTLYDEAGGHEAVTAAVTVFYNRVESDPELALWFSGVDTRRLRAHQKAFLAVALGGPSVFAGRDLASTHAGRAITNDAFDRVLQHLHSALRDVGMSDRIIAELMARVEAARRQVVVSTSDRESGGSRRAE